MSTAKRFAFGGASKKKAQPQGAQVTDGKASSTRKYLICAAVGVILASAGGLCWWFGCRSLSPVDAAIETLEHGDSDEKVAAVEQLARLKDPRAVRPLLKIMRDSDSSAARDAGQALIRMGSAAKAAVPVLMKTMNDTAARITTRINKTQEPWDHDVTMLIRSRSVLSGMGNVAAPELLKALQSDEDHIRFECATILADMEPPRKEAIPVLEQYLHAISVTGPDAALCLANYGEDARPAAIRLAARLKKGDEDQLLVLNTLATLGPIASDTVHAVCAQLGDKNEHVRRAAARVLGKIGRPAASGVAQLRLLLMDNERDVRVEAARAIWLITGDTARLPELLNGIVEKQLKEAEASAYSRGRINANAVRTLGEMGKAAATSLPALKKLLNSERPSICTDAAVAVWRISGEPEAPTEALCSVMRNRGKAAYYGSEEASPLAVGAGLAEIAVESSETMKRFLRLHSSLKKHRNLMAFGFMSRVRKAPSISKKSLDVLIGSLESPDADVRKDICGMLRMLGPKASGAEDALKALLKDKSGRVRRAAKAALNRVGGKRLPKEPE
jgi:HEAT repeat protein